MLKKAYFVKLDYSSYWTGGSLPSDHATITLRSFPVQPENTHYWGKYYSKANLHLDWLGFSRLKNRFSCLVETNPVGMETSHLFGTTLYDSNRVIRLTTRQTFFRTLQMMAIGAEPHVNTCYKHFYYFVTEFHLINEKEFEPLKEMTRYCLMVNVEIDVRVAIGSRYL